MEKVFIQMSGAPGAGKTTIAHAIAPQIGAVIIDHDVTKTALLDADIPISMAGKASYQVLLALAQHLLIQGNSVIFDSPCFYVELLERGQFLAQEANAKYLYIECVLDDLSELDRRLRTRLWRRSQVGGIGQSINSSRKNITHENVFQDWITNQKRPEGDYLILDTSHPVEVCVAEAIAYIKEWQVAGRV